MNFFSKTGEHRKTRILIAFFPLYDKRSKIVQNLDFFFFEMIIFLYKKNKGGEINGDEKSRWNPTDFEIIFFVN
jgi:hypothetical protein